MGVHVDLKVGGGRVPDPRLRLVNAVWVGEVAFLWVCQAPILALPGEQCDVPLTLAVNGLPDGRECL